MPALGCVRSGQRLAPLRLDATGARAIKALAAPSARRVRQRRVQAQWVGRRDVRVRGAAQGWRYARRLAWLLTKYTGSVLNALRARQALPCVPGARASQVVEQIVRVRHKASDARAPVYTLVRARQIKQGQRVVVAPYVAGLVSL